MRAPARSQTIKLWWLAGGVVAGAVFPVLGWMLAMREPGVNDVVAAHGAQPVLFIVDTAPLVLGAMAFAVGVFHAHLVNSRLTVEHQVEQRTAALRAALDELSATQAELLNAQKLEAVGGLAAGIAHEINTPVQYVGDNTRFVGESLAGLFALAEAASALAEAAAAGHGQVAAALAAYHTAAESADVEFLAEEIPTAIAESLQGIDQVASIVRALKSFAHPGSDEKSPEDLNEIVATTVAVARSEWKYVAEMNLNGLDPGMPMVPVLSGPLKQVVLNMIVNAAQAIEEAVADSGARGVISIATGLVDGYAHVEISDTGCGIPDEVKQRIFEPFFTTKEVGKGSGQGLAIAQSIVAKHGGRLRLDSQLGRGTTFTIELPLEQSSADVPDATASAA